MVIDQSTTDPECVPMILILESIKRPMSKEDVNLGGSRSLMSRHRLCTRRKSAGTGHTTPMLHQEGAGTKSYKQARPRVDIGPGNPSWMWQDAVVADLLAPTPDHGHPSVRECDTLQVPMYHHTNTMRISRECEVHRVCGGAKISIGQERRALKKDSQVSSSLESSRLTAEGSSSFAPCGLQS